MSETFEQWKAVHPSDTLTLSFDNQWRVELYGNKDAAGIIKDRICNAQQYGDCLPLRDAHPFIQSDDGEYLMIEFWTGNQSLILHSAEILARRAGLKLELL